MISEAEGMAVDLLDKSLKLRQILGAKSASKTKMGVAKMTRPEGTIQSCSLDGWKASAHHTKSPAPATLIVSKHAVPATEYVFGALGWAGSIEEKEEEEEEVLWRLKAWGQLEGEHNYVA